jgi:hypothetical protein
MPRGFLRSLGTVALVLAMAGVLWAGEAAGKGEPPLPEREMTVALRPKVGGIFSIAGDLEKAFDSEVHAEMGVKGTFDHFGLEGSLGTIRESGGGRITALKMTATFELNPLAGIKGHEKEGSLYLGGGFGYYPASDVASHDWDEGYGPHLVVGAEYYFNRVFGVFAECQYSYVLLDPNRNIDLHAISVLGGISFKF